MAGDLRLVRETHRDLGPGEAREDADIRLAEIGSRRHRQPKSSCDDVGSLLRPSEVARVDGIAGDRREALPEFACLRSSRRIERRIGMPLEPSLPVPIGLAVPREQNRRRHVGYGSRMPILEVTALPQAPEIDLESVAAALTHAVAAELGEDQSGTWVVWRTVQPGSYLEGSATAAVQPTSTHPPLTRVIAYEGREPEMVSRILAAVAETLVSELGLAEGNAFVTWNEARAGQVYTGGVVLGT